MKHWFLLSYLLYASLVHAQDANPCGSLRNAHGPYDYRLATHDMKSLVEGEHFTPGVESLKIRQTGAFGHDIGYTLRAFPNHPRALVAMERLAEKEKKDPPYRSPYSVECFYERALRFQPSDYVVRLLYASFLIGRGRPADDVTRHLDYISQSQADNPFAVYNVGLIFFDMKNYEQARAHAHKALKLGLMRGELKAKLERVGQWTEPTDADAPPTAASAAPPAASGAH